MSVKWMCFAAALAVAAPAPGQVFIRGDANQDGKVTLADGQAIVNYCYRWVTLPCREAADANDDGMINPNDMTNLTDFLFHRDYLDWHPAPPAPPYPEPGEDPGTTHRGCESPGGGQPLDDPAAKLELRESVVEGGASRRTFITVALTNSTTIGGYALRIADEASVIETDANGKRDYSNRLVELTGTIETSILRADQVGNVLSISLAPDYFGLPGIPPRADEEALRIPVCIKAGTPAGQYPLTLEMGELADFQTGRSIWPQLVSATLTVEADVGDLPCDYRAVYDDEVLFRLGDGAGKPGSEVALPLSVKTNRGAQGIEFSLKFDPEVLETVGADIAFPRTDGQPFWMTSQRFVEGAMGGAFVSAPTGVFLPLDEEVTFLIIRFRVKPEAPAGVTEVAFQNGAPTPVMPEPWTGCNITAIDPDEWCEAAGIYKNMLRMRRVKPATASSFVFVNGYMTIIGDVSFFRADSNSDLKVNITDAVYTIEYLFLGGQRPACLDAADANGDGRLDIADAVTTVSALFLGFGRIAPPFPGCAHVETGRLGCRTSTCE